MDRGMRRKPANDIQFGRYNPLRTNPGPQGRPTPGVKARMAYRADVPWESRGSASGDLQWDDDSEEDEYGYQYDDNEYDYEFLPQEEVFRAEGPRGNFPRGEHPRSHPRSSDRRPGGSLGVSQIKAEAELPRGAHRNDIDGVKTQVSDQRKVMVTLGHRVVYTFDVWVSNIGQGIDCLLGMNIMVAAGVRLSTNEGEVVLPDEERIHLVGGPKHDRMGTTFAVATHGGLWLVPGESHRLPLATRVCYPGDLDVWVSRGDSWVTLMKFGTDKAPAFARVVNISRYPVEVLPHSLFAALTEKGRLSVGMTFVCPDSRQYEEREQPAYENTYSRATERRLAVEARALERQAPPTVERPTYRTPAAILRRHSTPTPAFPHDPREPPGIRWANTLTLGPQVRAAVGTGATTNGGTPSALDADFDDGVAPETADSSAESRGASTPPAQAARELERVFGNSSPLPVTSPITTRYVMLATAASSPGGGQPAVYYHQGSDFILLGQLIIQLACLPDLSDLTNEARSMMRWSLLTRLLETGLIEYSTSAWASPIVIVMKKNGKDIRLCIDYRVVNQPIKPLNYPLPLIDELMSNFAATKWFMTLDMASGFEAVPMTARAKLISAFICPFGHFQWRRMPFKLKNAPPIYQQLLDNCLWGFVRLSLAEES
ncbi:unnamed protein product [Phytophthora fragariaefolia]|uniref:Unnamed protein product n=1 Tax=Phytophthora fragariaefolia TaxID=1490495 RepID=A0A9W6UDD8_9STRA|nr:unnamed protein product [Phytophthora fragariaefolia]